MQCSVRIPVYRNQGQTIIGCFAVCLIRNLQDILRIPQLLPEFFRLHLCPHSLTTAFFYLLLHNLFHSAQVTSIGS